MNLNRFETERQQAWAELEDLVVLASGRPESLGADRVRRLAKLYRSAAADLAYARKHFSFDPIVDRLEATVASARVLVYERPERTKTVWTYLSTGYWQTLYERRAMLRLTIGLAAAMALFGYALATVNPDGMVRVLPEGFLWVTEESSTDQGMGAVGLAGFSIFVMINNITVTIMAFLLGVAWGLGTFLSISYNAFILGALTQLALAADNGELLTAAIVGHGISGVFVRVRGGDRRVCHGAGGPPARNAQSSGIHAERGHGCVQPGAGHRPMAGVRGRVRGLPQSYGARLATDACRGTDCRRDLLGSLLLARTDPAYSRA